MKSAKIAIGNILKAKYLMKQKLYKSDAFSHEFTIFNGRARGQHLAAGDIILIVDVVFDNRKILSDGSYNHGLVAAKILKNGNLYGCWLSESKVQLISENNNAVGRHV